jgi:Tol biopolymer transport system component
MRCLLALLVLVGLAGTAPADAQAPAYDLLSVDSRERPADAATSSADVSATGRYVVFASQGRNLSTQDPSSNEWAEDVYLRDRRKGTTQLVSRATSGKAATGSSPSISPNGRFIAFCSYDKLVKPDEFELVGYERFLDVFVRDLRSGVTRRASTAHDGKMADDESCGARVANNGDTVFSSQATNLLRKDLEEGDFRTYLFDWSSRRVSRLGDVGGAPHSADISGDGRVAIYLDARDRARGDRNGRPDVYALDRASGRRELVTRRADGTPLVTAGCYDTMAVSDDGRFVLAVCNDGAMADPAVPDETGHLWLVDRRRRTNVLVNPVVWDPGDLNPREKLPMEIAISGDGRTVAFVGSGGKSYGGLPVDEDAIFVWRRGHGLRNLTPGPNDPWYPYGFALSGDGSYLAFTTNSPTISDQDPEDTAGPPQLDLFGVRVR